MRNATPEETQAYQQWFIEITFSKVYKGDKTKTTSRPTKTLGPFVGVSQEKAKEEALKRAQEKWHEGNNHSVTDWYNEFTEDIFFWDWKEAKAIGGKNFFEKLDSQLKPHGLEVVHIPFNGDSYPWFVDKIIT